ncbi:hypothetical protein Trydic_g22798 [Trypoxylus dichotomus]
MALLITKAAGYVLLRIRGQFFSDNCTHASVPFGAVYRPKGSLVHILFETNADDVVTIDAIQYWAMLENFLRPAVRTIHNCGYNKMELPCILQERGFVTRHLW